MSLDSIWQTRPTVTLIAAATHLAVTRRARPLLLQIVDLRALDPVHQWPPQVRTALGEGASIA
jgi:hypothetical protein